MEYSTDDLDAGSTAFPNGIPVPPVVTPECPLPGTALTCLNGLKHGGTARMLFIPGEQPQDFYNLLAESFETHQPSTIEHSALVTDSVLARWFLWRRQRAHSKREFEIFNESGQDDSLVPSGVKELDLYDRYCTAAERKLSRALANLERVKKSALNEQKWRAQHESQKAKFDLDLKRFELRKEQSDKDFSAPAHMHHLSDQEGLKVIEQRVTITKESEEFVTARLHPSNETVRRMIKNSDKFLSPPERIHRLYMFTGGIVPGDYYWVIHNLDSENLAKLSQPRVGVRTPMSFEAWEKVVAMDAA
jgi:hypothetical protein